MFINDRVIFNNLFFASIIKISVINMQTFSNMLGGLTSVCIDLATLIEIRTDNILKLSDQCLILERTLHGSILEITCVIIALVIGIVAFIIKGSAKRSRTFQSKLLDVKVISHDTKIFTFGLPNDMKSVGLNIGEHLELEAEINGRIVQRKYTPISRADVKRNSFELLIKVYFPLPPQFPQGGLMSQHVNNLKIGDEIKVTLPYGRFNYLGKSQFQIRELDGKVRRNKVDHIYMVGGGTGITPLYQIIQYVTEAEKPADRPDLTLLFANRTEEDILVKTELQAFQKENPTFKCFFSVDRSVKEDWKGFVGFINDQKIGESLGSRKLDSSLFVVCGPPILCNIVEKSLTTKFKVKPQQFFRF